MHQRRALETSMCAARACLSQVPMSSRRTNFTCKQPSSVKIATPFNSVKKFLYINTTLAEVDFGCQQRQRMSLRLLSPCSDVVNFTEKDISASPLRDFLPYWAFLWPGGYAITRCILDGSIQLQGHVVVDIGSGCASASIGAKMQGAALVIANDTDPFACVVAADNSKCNGTSDVITCSLDLLPLRSNPHDACAALAKLEARISQLAPHASCAPRLLLLGDMLYDCEIGPRVLSLAEAACARGWRVATGDPGRSIAVSQRWRLGKLVATYDLNQELRANNHGMSSSSVYLAGGD